MFNAFCRLIIASKFDPLVVLKEALVTLLPSSPFAIYCEFMEPLVECYMYLHQNVLAVRLQLCDTWKREFQTLPGRVHPQMRMPTSGGYILSGIYLSARVQYKEEIKTVEYLEN
jgi:tRNA (adenine-N(1)-)-methyltransferase non-catalytic subunit